MESIYLLCKSTVIEGESEMALELQNVDVLKSCLTAENLGWKRKLNSLNPTIIMNMMKSK